MVKDKTTKGDHLTVIKKANGSVELKWDWDALLNDVIKATNLTVKKETKKNSLNTKRGGALSSSPLFLSWSPRSILFPNWFTIPF